MRAVLAVAAAAALACAGAPPSQGGEPGRLYRQKCSGCHRPYEPESRRRAQWDEVMGRMAPRAHLSPEQEGTLRHWLAAHAADAGAGR